MSKIQQIFGADNNGRFNQRAEVAINQVRLQQEALINRLNIDIEQIHANIQRLMDLGPETSDSLRPVSVNFDASRFVNNLQEQKLSLRHAQIELETAVNTAQELFGDDPA
jgi:hypothetical protein